MRSTDTISCLDEAVNAVRTHRPQPPLVGVILGSGLGAFGNTLKDASQIPYADIPHMPMPSVAGHAGMLSLGTVDNTEVACLKGRVHLYEGHSPDRVAFGARLLARLGCKAVLITNAAGGVHPSLHPGDLMLITDHINLTGHNPLVGPNSEELGTRFPDMTETYDRALCAAARKAARLEALTLYEGVYLANLGPTYETPAEIRMARVLGADAVGMSTVPEVIALRHMQVRTAAISCITNLAAGASPKPLDHKEVEEVASRTRTSFTRLIQQWIAQAAPELAS